MSEFDDDESGGRDDPTTAQIAGDGVIASEFIDGYLAGMATLNAALAGSGPDTHFYSFDWIGDVSEPVDVQLLLAFQSDPARMAVAAVPIEDWRLDVGRLARKWLGRDLAPPAAQALSEEFIELLDTFMGGAGFSAAYKIEVSPPPGVDVYAPRIGSAYDHIVFELDEGRLLLEFVVDDR